MTNMASRPQFLVPQFPGLLSTSHDKLDRPRFPVTFDLPKGTAIPAEDVPNRGKPRLKHGASK